MRSQSSQGQKESRPGTEKGMSGEMVAHSTRTFNTTDVFSQNTHVFSVFGGAGIKPGTTYILAWSLPLGFLDRGCDGKFSYVDFTIIKKQSIRKHEKLLCQWNLRSCSQGGRGEGKAEVTEGRRVSRVTEAELP